MPFFAKQQREITEFKLLWRTWTHDGDFRFIHFELSLEFNSWGPFLRSLDNFSGPESCFMSARFTLKIQILFVLKAKQ